MNKEIVDAFEKMADRGYGVPAVPPHNEKERKRTQSSHAGVFA
ncbi:hypothetical protein [Paenibacillus cellulositrophicus]|nr:hypothetical protein [Paenibacillus cellulositrophicus]